MKRLIVLATAFTLAASASQAQTAGAGAAAGAQAGAQSASGAASTSGVILNQDFRAPPQQTIRQEGTTTLKNVPAVQAPSVFGGGHPCLAGQSGGIAVAGFGGSYGAGEAEVVCMLLYSGQHEAAIRALVMTNPTACKALAHVGYYIVPMGNGKSKAVPFNCGKETRRGGVYSGSVGQPAVQSATVSTKNRVPATQAKLFNTCYHDPASNQIKVKYTAAGRKDKARAAAACQRSLGF